MPLLAAQLEPGDHAGTARGQVARPGGERTSSRRLPGAVRRGVRIPPPSTPKLQGVRTTRPLSHRWLRQSRPKSASALQSAALGKSVVGAPLAHRGRHRNRPTSLGRTPPARRSDLRLDATHPSRAGERPCARAAHQRSRVHRSQSSVAVVEATRGNEPARPLTATDGVQRRLMELAHRAREPEC
jgi:hypothetical protein